MIAYRKKHPSIRKKLPDAQCGIEGLSTYNIHAEKMTVSRDDRIFSNVFAGYDETQQQDDLVYITINAYWDEIEIRLPDIGENMSWYLSVDTFGDEEGNYCFSEEKERRIKGSYVMRPRTVAVFTGRKDPEVSSEA